MSSLIHTLDDKDIQMLLLDNKGFSKDSETIALQVKQGFVNFLEPFSRKKVNTYIRFQTQYRTWKKATRSYSSITQKSIHPAYQAIISMGPSVLQLIFDEMVQEPDHWFRALSTITGENPIKEKNKGNIKNMTEDWLNWARAHGFLIRK